MTDSENDFTADGEDPALDERMCGRCGAKLAAGGYCTLRCVGAALGEAAAATAGQTGDRMTPEALGRSPVMARLSAEHSPAGEFSISADASMLNARYLRLRLEACNTPLGEFSIEGAGEDGEFRPIDVATLDAYASNFGMRRGTSSLDGVSRPLGEFLREVLPPGVEVHGLVLDHVVYQGWGKRWRRWALGLGMWLVRRSGCEVVKP